jgi:hypothetical protein
MSTGDLLRRQYRRVGLAWNDPDARRAYDREAQRRWRAKNVVRKRIQPQTAPERREEMRL